MTWRISARVPSSTMLPSSTMDLGPSAATLDLKYMKEVERINTLTHFRRQISCIWRFNKNYHVFLTRKKAKNSIGF